MAALYDALNGWGEDYDYWLVLARDLAPVGLTDLGCGTGQLTVLFARQAPLHVLGVDPEPTMLAVARQRDGHERVQWLEGYAADIPDASTDLITMTGHVSQVFLTDDDWLDALGQMRRSLRASGHLMFDMRNPLAPGWEEWNPVASRRSVHADEATLRNRIQSDPDLGPSSFRFGYLAAYAEAARTWLHYEAEVIDTSSLSPSHAAQVIAKAVR